MSEGLRHTGLVRTLLDIARFERFEVGVVVGDAVLRRLVEREQRVRVSIGDAADAIEQRCREMLLERLDAMPGTRGKARARRVVQFISAYAESPLESLFRLQLERLGFDVRTQVVVTLPEGTEYRMDFELVGYDVFIEADGKSKYLDEGMRNGRTLEQVLLEERHRENVVSGASGKRIIRGKWADAQTPAAMAAMLRAYRIEQPKRWAGRVRQDLFS